VSISSSVADVLLPGLKLSGSVALPDPNSAKASVDYTFCSFCTTKATVALTCKPVIDLVASTGYKDVIVGAEAGFDTATSKVSKYNVAVGYHAPDFQLSFSLLDKLSTLKVGFAHSVNSTTRVGAEVQRKLVSGDTTVNLGYAKVLTSGALAKLKVDNTGLLSALYETKLTSGEKVAGSFQLQATDLSKPVKYGFLVDLA
jgi:voltage-dependent anion channel protein 2